MIDQVAGMEEWLEVILKNKRGTPLKLNDCCKLFLEQQTNKIVSFKQLIDDSQCSSFIYLGNNHYKASISTKSEYAIYNSYAFAILIITNDYHGQLIRELELNDIKTKQLFQNYQPDIEKLSDILRKTNLYSNKNSKLQL